MDIEIVWGTGEGQTALSAFDAALATGGIHNYNLVELSSVIPADASVTVSGRHQSDWDVGEFVGVVLSATDSTVAGETIAAGLGWATADQGGVFFEATAGSRETVASLVTRGVESAQSTRDDWNWNDDIETKIVEHTVDESGAAVVAAVYDRVMRPGK